MDNTNANANTNTNTNTQKDNNVNQDKTEEKKNLVSPIKTELTEQFCSCCKPADFFDFLNKKNKGMFCYDTLDPGLAGNNGLNKSKPHKIFIKKTDFPN